jgi:hypothetical protein
MEAVKQLKYRYCAACDDDYDSDRLAPLFTEDAIWDGGPMGRYEDRYRREGERWRFERVTIDLRMLSPYEEGFAKVRLAEIPR